MADTEKRDYPVVIQTPPQYTPTPDRTGGASRCTVALSAYSAAVTALLLAAAIVGGILYHQGVFSGCDTQDVIQTDPSRLQTKVKDFEKDGKKVHEELTLDYDKQVEVIRLKHEGEATEGGLVVLDFKRMVTGMYLPEQDECYIIGGIGHDLGSPFMDGVKMGEKGDEYEEKPGGEDVLRKVSETPVKDLSALPEYLRSTCQHKNTYWLQRTTKESVTRKKRQTYCSSVVRCFYYLAYDNCCGYYYVPYCYYYYPYYTTC